MDVLLLRLDAPLLSFGGPMVDQYSVIQPFAALSMLTGMLANALGWDHCDGEKLGALQDRLRYASRADRPGRRIQDYQTADLDRDFMSKAWTTWGRRVTRGGGTGGTTQRYRDYWADLAHTVAVAMDGDTPGPTINRLARALEHPARPLFMGRKCCLPSGSILLGIFQGELMRVLAQAPPARGIWKSPANMPAGWFDGEAGAPTQSVAIPVTDERDWRNQIHVGRRLMRHGLLTLEIPSS